MSDDIDKKIKEMLIDGKTYIEIQNELRVSPSRISEVKKYGESIGKKRSSRKIRMSDADQEVIPCIEEINGFTIPLYVRNALRTLGEWYRSQFKKKKKALELIEDILMGKIKI
jgi:hypothetical protein